MKIITNDYFLNGWVSRRSWQIKVLEIFVFDFLKFFEKKSWNVGLARSNVGADDGGVSIGGIAGKRWRGKKQTKKQEHICISFHFICWFWFLEMFFWWSFVNISDCLSVLWMLTLIFEVKWWCFDWNELVLS